MVPTTILSVLALLTGSLHIRAFYRGQRQQIYIFKPLTTTLIILIALIAYVDEQSIAMTRFQCFEFENTHPSIAL